MSQQKTSLSVCTWFQDWLQLAPWVNCPCAPTPPPFTQQRFLDFRATFPPNGPSSFFVRNLGTSTVRGLVGRVSEIWFTLNAKANYETYICMTRKVELYTRLEYVWPLFQISCVSEVQDFTLEGTGTRTDYLVNRNDKKNEGRFSHMARTKPKTSLSQVALYSIHSCQEMQNIVSLIGLFCKRDLWF